MKKKNTLLIIAILAVTIILMFPKTEGSKIEKLRKQHAEFLKNHPYNKTLKLSRNERKAQGLPPNAYFEQQYLLEMNPTTRRAEFEKKFLLQKELFQKNRFQKNVPGSDDNAWIERGPSNVPGRTRAMLFDPNDATNERIFAGGVSGGLWVNNDVTTRSNPWERVGIPENLAVSSITFDPNNSMIMYIGTGESYVQGQVNGNGIWKSTNGGASWNHIFGGATGEAFFNTDAKMTINAPSSIQGIQNPIQAQFGTGLGTAITGNIVLVDDGTAESNLGCSTLVNNAGIDGNIALVERGTCNFTVKVKNAQDAGALAVIVINNVSGNPFAMSGTDGSITIPSVMISKTNGETILNALASETVDVTLENVPTDLPGGVFVPGIFHVNDIVTRDNGGTTEIYAAVADAIYRESPGTTLGQGTEYGLYRSINDGATWTKINLPATPGGNPFEPNDIEIGADNTIWLSTTRSSTFGDGGGTVFSSSNGTAFTQRHVVPNGGRTEIAVSLTNANKIYILAQESPITIIKTIDGFATTTTQTLPDDADNGIPANDFTRGQAFYDLMIEISPISDELIFVGGIDIHRSSNGGLSWTQISKWSNNANLNTLTVPLVHADIHALTFNPSNPNSVMIATDGGVYYSNAISGAGSSTSAIFGIPNGFNTTQFYWGEIGQNASNDQFLGGTQDNGSPFIDGADPETNVSFEVTGGDGGYSFIDKDGDYMITAFPNNNFTRFNLPFTTGGDSQTIVNEDNEGSFINPAELDDNLDILYTDGSTSTAPRVSRFSNITTTNPIRLNLVNSMLDRPLTALKISPYTTSSSTLFVGTDSGRLLKITNANANGIFSEITGPEFLGSISAINFGANENQIFVTFHNYGVDNIWYTADGGTTWVSKEGDFPDIPVKAIMMNPLLNNEVIIGTDLGVWRTANFSDTNPNWVQSQNGMQNVKVTSLDLRIADNTVLATTYGRGFFTGKFTAAPLSIEEISAKDDRITLFPNPSDGNLKIRTTIDFGVSKITVFDINGRTVFSQNSVLSETTDLNVSNLKSGLYILRIQSEQFGYNKKFFIK